MPAGGGLVSPADARTHRPRGLDPKEADATAPGREDFRRVNQTKDLAKRREILEGILAKYGDTPVAATAAWCLAINRADAGAPEAEVRGLIDQAARIAARHGREMEIGAISLIVDNLIGAEGREELVLEYARKAVAMLRPDDSAALQIPTLKNLVAALRKSRGIDEGRPWRRSGPWRTASRRSPGATVAAARPRPAEAGAGATTSPGRGASPAADRRPGPRGS